MQAEIDLTVDTHSDTILPSKKKRRVEAVVDLTDADDAGASPGSREAAGPPLSLAGLAAERRARRSAGGSRQGQQQQQQQQQQQEQPREQQVELQREQPPYAFRQLSRQEVSAPHGRRQHLHPHHVHTRQQQQQQRCSPPKNEIDDFGLAKRLQEEEDQRAAAAVEAEDRLQRRFRELEAAEAAAGAADTDAAAERGRGWGMPCFGGGRSRAGSSGGAAAAAAAAGGGAGAAVPRAGGRGPRTQRSRRSPAAEAEYAAAMGGMGGLMGTLFGPPLGLYGGRGRGRGSGLFGEGLQQMLAGLHRGLPADLLLSGRDFTDADYEQLLALDAGNKKQLAPRERVTALETVRVPPAGRGGAGAAAAAAAAASGRSGSPNCAETCAICLEDARPGDRFRVLPCRHAFHVKCIDRWLTQERNACPVCMQPPV